MAATATAYVSSSIFNNLSFTHSSISLTTTNFPQRPISHKPFFNLTLKSQTFILSSLPLQSQDTIISQQQEPEPEPETSDKPKQDEEQKVTTSDDAGRLYVGNLPFSTTSSELAEIFAEAGTVVSVEIVYDRLTDRSRGFAFVTMKSAEEAKEAIRMFDGSQVGGRSAKVNFPEVPKGGETLVMRQKVRNSYRGFVDSPHKIYAGNLGWGVSYQDLRDAFDEQPGLLGAKVIYERDNGRSRGFGFVTFETAEHLEAALNAMNGVEVQGRPLRLNLAAAKTSPSPPVIEENTKNNVESSELVSSAST